MSSVNIDADKLDRLADVVGAKSGVPLKLTIDGMVDAVLSIEEGITPTGTKHITSNGKYDVVEFAQAEVDVKAPPIKTQAKTVIPTEDQRTVLPDSGYDGLSEVTVQPIVYNDLVLTPGTASEVYYSPRTTNSVTFLRRGVVIPAGQAPAFEYSKSEQFDTSKTLHASLWCSVRPYQRESYEILTDVLWVASDGMWLYNDDSISVYVNSSKLFVTNMLDVDVTLDIQFDAYCDAIEGVTLKGVKLQDISVTPTKQHQYLRPEQPNMGFKNVTVQAIPAQYVDTSDADAVAADIALGRTAYAGGHKLTGTLAPVEVEPLSVTANGTYTAPTGHAYSPVTVNVSGGGGGGGSMSDPIRFFDYDGALVASYSAVPSELPDVPTHTGLVDGTWNYTLAEVGEQFGAVGACDIGANYATESGATEIDVEFVDAVRLSPYLRFALKGTVTVDWGDGGATDTVTGTSLTARKDIQHVYAAPGKYTIKLTPASGTTYAMYSPSASYTLLHAGTASNLNYIYAHSIMNVRLGKQASIGNYAFSGCKKLESVTLYSGITVFGNYAFDGCSSLQSITIPDGVSNIPQNMCSYCGSIKLVSLPASTIRLYSYSFQNCSGLDFIVIPANVTSIATSAFDTSGISRMIVPQKTTIIPERFLYSCLSLRDITLSANTSRINSYAFQGGYLLVSLVIPASVTNIGSYAFSGCAALAEVHLEPTNPPTLGGTNTFNSIPSDCKFYVPYSEDHSILAAYQAASNWSTYASRMVEEPQS